MSDTPKAQSDGTPQTPAGDKPPAIMRWYVLRVASNKEEQVRDALTRRIQIENMTDRVGRVLVPTVPERRVKGGQSKVYNRKLYPGYVFVEMLCEEDGSIQEDVWFLIKETTGVGDFIGSEGKPSAMNDPEVEKMLAIAERPDQTQSMVTLQYKKGDRVKIREGSFENFEGEVDSIDEQKQTVTVLITIFGRSTPVDVEYWNLERT
jgi:transcriptional antiterminator NusG